MRLVAAVLAPALLVGGIGLRAAPAAPAEERAVEERAAAEDEAGFVALFDGKSLEGWEGEPRWFTVRDGAIVAGSLEDSIPHNFFLATEREFEDFELRLEAKLVGPGDNAGVQFRTERVADSHEVSGYQADMGSSRDRPIWGSLYDESRRNRMLAEPDADAVRRVLRAGQWNTMVVRAQGPRIQIWLNGFQTVDYTETDDDIPRRGIIALQIHGGRPAEASYRNLRIKEF